MALASEHGTKLPARGGWPELGKLSRASIKQVTGLREIHLNQKLCTYMSKAHLLGPGDQLPGSESQPSLLFSSFLAMLLFFFGN